MVFAGEPPGDLLFFVSRGEAEVLDECFADVLTLHHEHFVEYDLKAAGRWLKRFEPLDVYQIYGTFGQLVVVLQTFGVAYVQSELPSKNLGTVE